MGRRKTTKPTAKRDIYGRSNCPFRSCTILCDLEAFGESSMKRFVPPLSRCFGFPQVVNVLGSPMKFGV